jgi:hypothetical protein
MARNKNRSNTQNAQYIEQMQKKKMKSVILDINFINIGIGSIIYSPLTLKG